MITILYQVPGHCPICKHELVITNASCPHCRTRFEGEFAASRFSKLTDEQLNFVEAFIRSRGNLKDMEKEVELSYPTIRSRLEEIIQVLGYSEKKDTDGQVQTRSASERKKILDALEKGEITPSEAADRLKGIKK